METRQLRYFVVVAQEQHFHRAAQRLRIAQPALSRWIAALEREVGVKLFERVGRGVQLSDAGRALARDAGRILDDLDRSKQHLRMVARGQTGTLRLAFCEVGAGNGLMPDVVQAFRAAEPDVELSLRTLTSPQQIAALQAGEIDGGFLYRFAEEEPAGKRTLLASESTCVVVPKGHPLAKCRSVRLGDLKGQPLLCVDRAVNPRYHEKLTLLLAQNGMAHSVAQYASSSEVIQGLVSVGMGLGFSSSAGRWRPAPDIAFVPLKEPGLDYRFEFAFGQPSAALGRFAEILSQFSSRRTARPKRR
jgi:DNA-binding transcriptional LysR family regulator